MIVIKNDPETLQRIDSGHIIRTQYLRKVFALKENLPKMLCAVVLAVLWFSPVVLCQTCGSPAIGIPAEGANFPLDPLPFQLLADSSMNILVNDSMGMDSVVDICTYVCREISVVTS